MSAVPPGSDILSSPMHVRFVPCVDGSGLARGLFTSQAWSVRPCVRPLAAVHMTAGHNALRSFAKSNLKQNCVRPLDDSNIKTTECGLSRTIVLIVRFDRESNGGLRRN